MLYIYILFVETILSLLCLNCSCLLQVKEVAPAARRRNAKLSFAFVYPDKHGRFLVKEVGVSVSLLYILCACICDAGPMKNAL